MQCFCLRYQYIFPVRGRGESRFELPCCYNSYFSITFLFVFCDHFCRTVVGIRGKDGVVLGVERLVQSKLYEDNANKCIFHIDRHIGMVSSYFVIIYVEPKLVCHRLVLCGSFGTRSVALNTDHTRYTECLYQSCRGMYGIRRAWRINSCLLSDAV
jgi:hypothetical protein